MILMLKDGFTNLIKNLFDFCLLTSLYVGGILTLGTDWQYVLAISSASVAGSIVLAYFRRDRDYKEIFFKSACASILGLVVGAVSTKYYNIEATEYVIGVYFFASLLSIFFIKGLLSFVENNATQMVITVFQKFLPSGVVKTSVAITKDGEAVSEKVTN